MLLNVRTTVIFGLQGTTFFLKFDPSVLCAACTYYVDELQYVSSDYVSTKNNVDVNSISVVIKALTKAKIRADDCSLLKYFFFLNLGF